MERGNVIQEKVRKMLINIPKTYLKFKKVFIADQIAPIVEQIFQNSSTNSLWDSLFGCYFFGIQLYCDFAGYTDMARGFALLCGIELSKNFNAPLLASTRHLIFCAVSHAIQQQH